MANQYQKEEIETVDYYERNASAFVSSTITADVSELYKNFEELLSPGCRILDLGCGSGRDSRYFSERGCDVVALDPSRAMCEQTRAFANVPVLNMRAEEMRFTNEFDAVWACASLLHVPRDKQLDTLILIGNALKAGGVCYCSWKYGEGDRTVDGRHFTDYTEETFGELLERAAALEEIRVWVTRDVRADRREQRWLNVLLRKKVVQANR